MNIPEYTLLTVGAVIATVATERWVFRTGIFRQRQYWTALGIIAFFQVLTDGWLTKLSDPIVRYNPAQFSGLRFPWDIPVEDFGFGFAMVTLTMMIWLRLTHSRSRRPQ